MKVIKTLLIATAIFLASCNPKLVPVSDPAIAAEVLQADQSTTILYNTIIASSDKSFSVYEARYSQIQDILTDIAAKDAVRPQGKFVLKLVNGAKERFTRYESDHQLVGRLNDSQLTIRRKEMEAIFATIENSENNFK